MRYCKEIPAVKWIKINDTNHFMLISETNHVIITQEQTVPEKTVSYLSFKNISRGDIGIYRCMISTPAYSLESHNINVNVSGKELIQIYKKRSLLNVESCLIIKSIRFSCLS